jgi:hypothetical protein
MKIHNHKAKDRTVANQPFNEGFILLLGNQKKLSPKETTKSAELTVGDRIFTSYNTSSTTCNTRTVGKHTPTDDQSLSRRNRRLVNDLNNDTNIETTAKQTPITNESEIDSFLRIDDEQLSALIFNTDTTVDGSSESMFPLESYTFKNLHFYFHSNWWNNWTNIR